MTPREGQSWRETVITDHIIFVTECIGRVAQKTIGRIGLFIDDVGRNIVVAGDFQTVVENHTIATDLKAVW